MLLRIDMLIGAILTPLAITILISGFDDLLVDIVWAAAWVGERIGGPASAPEKKPDQQEKRIAIFIPLWKEHAVIRRMLEHNIAAIDYANYDIFIGAYPNDDPTLQAIREIGAGYPNVFLAVCPHQGPTSKADCLNWIFQSLLSFEETQGGHFDAVLVHDAEDLIHPDALSLIDQKLNEYDTVQVPVLPLATRFGELTHGIYCDEFAEFQTIDMPARGLSGSFLPSNGVGTGYSRAVLDRLAEKRSNRVFEPASLTEDYESGVRIYQLGFRQYFAELERRNGEFLATREYFPQTFHAAVRQRTRWVTGICLQGWERLGWHESGITRYWFWRDRKALLTNPIGLLVSLFMVLSLADLSVAYLTGTPWHFGIARNLTQRLCWANLAVQAIRTAVRMACASRVYGWRFASGVPVRAFYESIINGIATLHAIRIYVAARMDGRPLVWLKTEHYYPSRATLESSWKGLEEVLVGSGYLAAEVLAVAHRLKAPDADLGHFLVAAGLLSEEDYCEAASLCTAVYVRPIYIDPATVPQRTARSLPMRVQSKCRVTPFHVQAGQLYLATPQTPATHLIDEIQRHTRLQVNYRIVTPSNYAELRSALFGEPVVELALGARATVVEQRAFAAAG